MFDEGTDVGAAFRVTEWKEFQNILEQANKNNTKIYLSGVKPHLVGDHSTTSGFGDYLRVSDMPYYESKGYIMKKKDIQVDGETKSFVYFDASEGDDGIINDVGYIPTNIVVEKYLQDIENMESDMRRNLKKEIGGNALYYSWREFDALIIARYNKGALGINAQNCIVNYEKDSEKWKDALEKVGISQDRATWVIDNIMFGEGDYIEGGIYTTPLYGVHVEGITDE